MLLVEAALAVVSQKRPEHIPLPRKPHKGQDKEDCQRTAGEVNSLRQKQGGLKQHHIQRTGPEEPSKLLIKALLSEGLVQAEGGKGKQIDRGQNCGEPEIGGKRDCNYASAQHEEPNDKRYWHGKKQNQAVQQYIEVVQHPLILFDHASWHPFR